MQNQKIRIQALLIAAVLAFSPMSVAAEDIDGAAAGSEEEFTDNSEDTSGIITDSPHPDSESVQDSGEQPNGALEEEEDGQPSRKETGSEKEPSGKTDSEEDGLKENDREVQAADTGKTYDLSGDPKLKVRFKDGRQTFSYTGSEIKPEIEVAYTETTAGGVESTTLLDLEHFNISYQNHINAGMATVLVEGKDEQTDGSLAADQDQYIGSQTLKFTISPAALSACRIEVSNAPYTGQASIPAVVLTYNGRTLKEKTDYQISFSGHQTIGTATALIQGIGNFTGTVSKNFEVELGAPSLKASSTAYNKIKLTWNKPKSAGGYQLQRSTAPDSGFKTIKKYSSGSKKSYVNKGVSCGRTYYYRIRSYAKIKVKVNGKKKTKTVYSPWSAVVDMTTALNVTKIKSAKGASKTSIKVSWKKCAGAQGYEIFRCETENGTYVLAGTSKGTSYTNKNLAANSTWYYKVRAYRKLGGIKVYGGFSGVKEGKVKTTKNSNSSGSGSGSGSSNIYASGRLGQLFPNGVPTTAADMQPYLVQVTVPIKVLKSDKKTYTSNTLVLTVHKDLKDKVYSVFQEMYNINFPITSGSYCYSWREVTGSSGMSHHSYGVAVDINPASNPMVGYTNGTYNPGVDPWSVTPEVIAIWEKYGFYWGGNFSRAKDYMHFSYTGY